MTHVYEKTAAVIILLTALAVAVNAYFVDYDSAWEWINPLMGIAGGYMLAVLARRDDAHARIIKYVTLVCMLGMVLNLAVLEKLSGFDFGLLWYPIDAVMVVMYAWFGIRELSRAN